ncbi:MAG: hypothetical protein U0411_13345 [Thermodesulfovibrionales bacterium]
MVLSNASPFLLLLLLPTLLFFPGEASGAVSFDLETRGVYEDNLSGSAVDAEKQGDFYTILGASCSFDTQTEDVYSLSLRGDAERYLYRRYSDLNASTLGISAGITRAFGYSLAASLSLKGRIRDFPGGQRDGRAYGGALVLKHRISFRHWVTGEYEYERNSAGADIYSYKGHRAGVVLGSFLTPRFVLQLGYSLLTRKYEDEFRTRTTFHTLSSGISRQVAEGLSMRAEYHRQFISSNALENSHSNNIYSLGLLYSF